ncbi:MAG TPA: ArsR family transcriptional regulator [Pyrinomonadaceae bacterium]|nr:ArsR family transcriptional regulator [Pyrinomonadaceae bacterium]
MKLERFLESTRGQIVTLLRANTCTVDELAEKLSLTDNAVRSHLATLERDGLVRQTGLRRGARKPHFTYALTDEADRLFPKAYDALLNQLIAVLKSRLNQSEIEGVLREVGRAVAGDMPEDKNGSLESRAQRALSVLEAIGGSAQLELHKDRIVIQGNGCPLAAAVAVHPEVCQLAETLVSEIVKAPVEERCDRTTRPQCRFEIETNGKK